MIKIKNSEEIEIMRESALVVSRTLGILAKEVKPGVTTLFLDKIAEELEKRMMKSETKGKTITLKIKYSDFTQQTRSKTVQSFIQTKEEIIPIVKELVYQEKFKNSVRLLGISFSNLDTEKKDPVWVQLKLEF